MYIVDGVEQPIGFDLKSIKPVDIKEIKLIKDASVIIAYGDKGKNGVISITTNNQFQAK